MKLGNLDQIDVLLIKCLEGSASEPEMKEAWAWIESSSENKTYYEHIRNVFLAASVYKPISEKHLDDVWEQFKISHKLGEKPRWLSEPKGSLSRFIKVAAIITIAFILGAFAEKYFFTETPLQSNEYYIVEAPRGAKSFLTLVDGTKIWLNAGSKISYQRSFNQENRKIFLVGEAFFEVAKNADLPFYVHSAGIVVRAIGTAFNVKAYPEEGIVETTLVEGSVSIESTGKSGKKEKILMTPNQKANFYKASREIVIQSKEKEKSKEEVVPIPVKVKIERVEIKREIDTDLYTSWKDKRWVFEKQRLEEFSVILERLYDVKVTFKDEELKNYRLSGSFREENLEQVLEAIQMTVPLEYSVVHDEVIFAINKKMKSSYKKILKNVNN